MLVVGRPCTTDRMSQLTSHSFLRATAGIACAAWVLLVLVHLAHIDACPFGDYLPGGYLIGGHPSLLGPDSTSRWLAAEELFKSAALVAASVACVSLGILAIRRVGARRAGLIVAGVLLVMLAEWVIGGFLPILGPAGLFRDYTTPAAGPGDNALSVPIGWNLWISQIQVYFAVSVVLAIWFLAAMWVWLGPSTRVAQLAHAAERAQRGRSVSP